MPLKTNRLLASLLRALRAPGRMLFAVFVRRAKTGPPDEAAPCDRSHSSLAILSVETESVSSAGTSTSEDGRTPPAVSAVSIDRLPFELLCNCLGDFYLEELLPLRLVSRAFLEAVNVQDEYSRYIDNMPEYILDDDMDKVDEFVGLEEQTSFSVDLLKARITCSSRIITLHVGTSWLPDRYTEAIISLISEHLERIEVLWVELSAKMALALFTALQRPIPSLRDLTLRIRTGDNVDDPVARSAVLIPPNIFTGHAPLLKTLCLLNAAIDPSADYTAFSRVTSLNLHYATLHDVHPPRILALCPQLESLSIEADEPAEHDVFRLSDAVPVPRLKELRIAVPRQQDQLDLLNALSSPATEEVSMAVPDDESLLAMLSQLRGLGPLTFFVDSDQSSELFRMHIQLASPSTNRVRTVEVHEYEHWDWEDAEAGLLESFEACALARDIVLIHLVLRPRGTSPLSLLAWMVGDWPAVRTVRIDVRGGRAFAPTLCGGFPDLVQVVIFHPDLRVDTPQSEVSGICSRFMDFYACSETDTFTFVLTRDAKTATVVTADPGAAAKNPQCIVCRWQREYVVVESLDNECKQEYVGGRGK
ncbi:hypothetical protein AURDEDRAFT_163895 [Auricularia subglabra TFB-10046 SS5]|nr:hypothetical protein AURDEDRAFT_163895 [Auricularia subglabra TFB-10046 SS5]